MRADLAELGGDIFGRHRTGMTGVAILFLIGVIEQALARAGGMRTMTIGAGIVLHRGENRVRPRILPDAIS